MPPTTNMFGRSVTGPFMPGPGYQPGLDPEFAHYAYGPLPLPQDATGGASRQIDPQTFMSPMSPREARGEGGMGGDRSGTEGPVGVRGLDSFGTGQTLGAAFGPAMALGPAAAPIGGLTALGMSALNVANKLGFQHGVIGPSRPQVGTQAFRDVVSAGADARQKDAAMGTRSATAASAQRAAQRNSLGIGGRAGGGGRPGAMGGNRAGGRGGGATGRAGPDPHGGGFHMGGQISDNDPGTHRDNMEITAQEGEFVVSRPAIAAFGMEFFDDLNRAALGEDVDLSSALESLQSYVATQGGGKRLPSPESASPGPQRGETYDRGGRVYHDGGIVRRQVRPLKPGEFVENKDGSRSTERTLGVSHPQLNAGKPTLIPSIWMVDGKIVELPPEAEDRAAEFAIESKMKFPAFNTFDESTEYAKRRSGRGGAFQGPLGVPALPPTTTPKYHQGGGVSDYDPRGQRMSMPAMTQMGEPTIPTLQNPMAGNMPQMQRMPMGPMEDPLLQMGPRFNPLM